MKKGDFLKDRVKHIDVKSFDSTGTIKKIADSLAPRPYSSREFVREMGKYLVDHAQKPDSLVQAAQGGVLVGQGGHRLRTDGLCRGKLCSAADH
jgi:hypothetical protein